MVKSDVFWGPLMRETGDQTPFNVLRAPRYLSHDILQFWLHSVLSVVHISRQNAETIRKRTGFMGTQEDGGC